MMDAGVSSVARESHRNRCACTIPAVTESDDLIYAHRGASAIHPENTLRAFRHALAIGVDGIELDVHATADGIPVVIHDRDVGRTTDGAGYVDEIAAGAARDASMPGRRARADARRGPRAGRRCRAPGHRDQGRRHRARGVGRACSNIPLSRWAISSFAWDTLRTVRRLDPVAEVWPLAERVDDDLIAIAAELAVAGRVALHGRLHRRNRGEAPRRRSARHGLDRQRPAGSAAGRRPRRVRALHRRPATHLAKRRDHLTAVVQACLAAPCGALCG